MKHVPLFGLSILVHLLIIALYRAFGRDRVRVSVAARPVNPRRTSFLIVTFVLLLVLANASLIMWSVVTERHSSFVLAGHAIQEWEQASRQPQEKPATPDPTHHLFTFTSSL